MKKLVVVIVSAFVAVIFFQALKTQKPASSPNRSENEINGVTKQKQHTLTWRNYNGFGDPSTAVYILSGKQIGTGNEGLAKLKSLLKEMSSGTQVFIVPYYGASEEGVQRKYPFPADTFTEIEEKYGVTVLWPGAA